MRDGISGELFIDLEEKIMAQVSVQINGNNLENVRAFWIDTQGRWGSNGQPWDAVTNIANGNYNAGVEVVGLPNVTFGVTIPSQPATIVYEDDSGNEIIVAVIQNPQDDGKSIIGCDANS